MSNKRAPAWSSLQLLALAAGLLGACWMFHLGSAAAGKSYYRDIHLGTALEYAWNGIDLFNPIIVGFNATRTPTPQELPLWQAAAALAFRWFGPWFGWANVVSLALFSTCLFPLHRMARAYYGERCAGWTLVFFLAQPLVFLYAGLAGTDGFSLAAAIWFMFCAVRLLQAPHPGWWAATLLSAVIAALSKLPFFMAAGLGVFFLAAAFHRGSLRPWVWLGSVAVVTGGLFYGWTVHTNRCYARAEFPFVDLRLSTPSTFLWFFGDWQYRLSPGHWLKGGWRFLNACFGSLALAGLALAALVFPRRHVFAKVWLAGAVLTTLIFTHLVLHHWHYYLMFCPAVALLCAQSAAALEELLTFDSKPRACLGLGVVALCLGLSVAQGLIAMKIVLFQDPYVRQTVKIIEKETRESDKLLIEGGGWGGEELMLAHRQGLSIWNTEPLEEPGNLRRLKELGYNKLVMISESPLLVAAESVNPGEARGPRRSYLESLTPVAKSWPVVYQDENILIKELP